MELMVKDKYEEMRRNSYQTLLRAESQAHGDPDKERIIHRARAEYWWAKRRAREDRYDAALHCLEIFDEIMRPRDLSEAMLIDFPLEVVDEPAPVPQKRAVEPVTTLPARKLSSIKDRF